MYLCRVAGHGCESDDWILRAFRFTNAFRACDRVSQYLIRDVQYALDPSPDEVIFRTLLFKLFNKVETWVALAADGPPTTSGFGVDSNSRLLTERMARGLRIYSAAYIVPPILGCPGPKHVGHLKLVAQMIDDDLPGAIRRSDSLEETFHLLKVYSGIGDFLAFQLAVDISYSSAVNFDDSSFVKAGPGARDGIKKCFPEGRPTAAEAVIGRLCERQEEEFSDRGLFFAGLFGRRLQPVDVQNLFCEVSKYTRAAMPGLRGTSDRKRIKQRYACAGALPTPFFPPKWGLGAVGPVDLDADGPGQHVNGDDTPARCAQAVEGAVSHENGFLPFGV